MPTLVSVSQTITLSDDTVFTLPAAVDEATSLATQIAVLTARYDELKAGLIKTGLAEVCGSQTRAVISHVAASSRPDWKAIAATLEPSDEVIAAHQTAVAASDRLSIKGYNARKAA
jgi:hypothetical protein